jgi:tRNA1(Val) A37 N6-methylase TrmN6
MLERATVDALFGGALRLHQPLRGHRAGTDGVLLAAATPPDSRAIADFGASTGLVGLRAAQMNGEAQVTLFEQDAETADLARANIGINGLEARVMIVEGDLLSPGALREWREAFDCVLTNPPFHEPGRARVSARKSAAYVLAARPDGSGLEAWIKRATSVLKPKGRLVMIHRADETGALLAACRGRFGGLRLIFVHPKRDQPAIRVLAGAIKGSRAPLAILPPLILHADDGGFSDQVERLNRGEASLPLFG